MAADSGVSKSLGEVLSFEDSNYRFSGESPDRKLAGADGALLGIIDTLQSEHGYIAHLLDALEREANRLKPGKIPDYPLLLEIVDYLTHYPGQYHHPREDLLFSKLLERDPRFEKQIQRLDREHETLRVYNDKLFQQLSAIVAGGPADRPELLGTLKSYVRGYRTHISFESEEIFSRAKGKLSAADLRKLDSKTRYIDDPLFGGFARKRYRRLGRKLQAAVGSISFEIASREYTAFETIVSKISELVTTAESLRSRRGISFPRRRRGGGPSWQARVMNGFARTTMKPLMRFGSVESARALLARLDAQQAERLPGDIKARPVRNKDYEGEWVQIAGKRPKKVILYFPGGGFILRTATQHKGMVARICREANTRALIVHYSLAPEIPFPGGLEDCLAAYHDLLDQGIDPSNITLAGDSAGGGLVLSTLLALRDEGSPMPVNAIILSPLGDLTYSGESRKFNKYRDPVLPTHRSSQMHELYIGDALPEDRYISPVLADFDGLPPILGQVGSTEILLDDTVRAAERAEEAGVPFFLEIWNEMPHVFPMFGLLPEGDVAIERMSRFINTSELDELPERYAEAA